MNGKKIFIVSTEFPPGPGGIGSHAFQVAKELHNLGWQVTVFTEQANCPEEEITVFNKNSAFKINRFYPTPSVFLLIKKFITLFFAALTQRPHIVMGTGKHGAWFAVLAGKLALCKTVVIGHGTEFIVEMSARSRKINNWVYSNATGIVYVSKYTKQIAESAGITNAKPSVIHNGADDSLFYPLAEKDIEAFKTEKQLTGKKIIITVGNVQPRKGHEFVLRALPKILETVPNVHYYCVGPPSIKTYLLQIAEELGVSGHLHFTGRILNSELLLWLNACHVFALTSVATEQGDIEGFGIAVVEAALSGKPAVVTNQSGPGEAIVEGLTGLGVKEKDIAGIAEKITLLLTNDSLRTKMGVDARNYALQNLTWKLAIQKYDQVIKRLIA